MTQTQNMVRDMFGTFTFTQLDYIREGEEYLDYDVIFPFCIYFISMFLFIH